MKRFLSILLITVIPLISKAQYFSASFKISIQPPTTVDIILVVDNATIGFNRQDVISEYQKLKQEYAFAQNEVLSFAKAIDFVTASSEKIIVNRTKPVKSELFPLDRLLQIRIATVLLLAGKAEVIRSSSKTPEQEIIWRQLLPDPAEGGQYKFSFTDGDEFFVGRQLGVYVREDITGKGFVPVDSNKQEVPVDNSNSVFYAVELQAEPPGGIIKFTKEYLPANVKYPSKKMREGLEGNVFVKFIINTDGTLTGFEIVKGLHPDLDQEAIRVLKDGGLWKPAMQSGRIVRSQFVIPVRFKLPER